MEKGIVTLYAIYQDGDKFTLNAQIDYQGNLVLGGLDYSKEAERMFGDDEYIYSYTLDPSNVEKLKKVLKTEDILDALSKFFNGEMKNQKFRELCESNGIKYSFRSY